MDRDATTVGEVFLTSVHCLQISELSFCGVKRLEGCPSLQLPGVDVIWRRLTVSAARTALQSAVRR